MTLPSPWDKTQEDPGFEVGYTARSCLKRKKGERKKKRKEKEESHSHTNGNW